MLNDWVLNIVDSKGLLDIHFSLLAYHKDKRVSQILVDPETFKDLKALNVKWSISATGYAHNHKHGYLHRYIMGNCKIPAGFVTDHINRNKLDNRRTNLRIVSRSINAINQLRTSNPLNCTGVYKIGSSYVVRICGKYLGSYKNLDEAIDRRKAEENILIKLNGSSSDSVSSDNWGSNSSLSSTDDCETGETTSDGEYEQDLSLSTTEQIGESTGTECPN